jgi:peptidoglycan hydrolase CwlO-like protein
MNVDIVALIGLIGTISGVYLGFWKAKKNGEKSIKEDTVQNTVMATKLDSISKGVDDIRIDFKTQAREIQRMQLDQARLDESVKSAHHRIDELQEIIKKEGLR